MIVNQPEEEAEAVGEQRSVVEAAHLLAGSHGFDVVQSQGFKGKNNTIGSGVMVLMVYKVWGLRTNSYVLKSYSYLFWF